MGGCLALVAIQLVNEKALDTVPKKVPELFSVLLGLRHIFPRVLL
jgi:hypothetical protein